MTLLQANVLGLSLVLAVVGYIMHNSWGLRGSEALGLIAYHRNQHCGIASKRTLLGCFYKNLGTTAESNGKSRSFSCTLYPFPSFLRW